MKFGVLTDTSNFMFLGHEYLTKGKTGVAAIIVTIPEAIEWLQADTQNQLIVILPLDERNRNTIEKSLIDDRDRCIGLEPAMLLSGSNRVFRRSHELSTDIIKQIRNIVESETMNA